MDGMDGATGRPLGGVDHLRQSIRDILTTPIGSRVMRREYGSRLFQLVDRPIGPELDVAVKAAVAEALDRWEPRIRLTRVETLEAGPGTLTLRLEAEAVADGELVVIDDMPLPR